MSKQRQAGFTIIELLIATAVFSVVLLVISTAVIQIGRLYYKGITSAHTQETARSVMTDIAQAIQFETGGVVGTNGVLNTDHAQAICIATRHYSYVLGQQRINGQHAFVSNEVPSGCGTTPAQNISAGGVSGQELLGEHMRLANLVVEQLPTNPDGYRITVRIVYGDQDLVCSPTSTATGAGCSDDTNAMGDSAIAAARDLRCKDIRSGSQFCAVSELSTIVERRLQ